MRAKFVCFVLLLCFVSPLLASDFAELGSPGPYKVGHDSISYWQKPYGLHWATIRYPAVEDGWHKPQAMNAKPYPVVLTSSGFLGARWNHTWLAEHLTSHGYVTVTITPPMSASSNATQWANAFIGAIDMLEEQNARQHGAVYAIADMSRIGVSGFSMGGGGTIEATSMDSRITAAAPLAPVALEDEDQWWYDGVIEEIKIAAANIKVPTMMILGSNDRFIYNPEVKGYYDLLPETTPKAFLEVDGANHVGYVDKFYANVARGTMIDNPSLIGIDRQKEITQAYILAWFNIYLKDQAAQKSLFTGYAGSDFNLSQLEVDLK